MKKLKTKSPMTICLNKTLYSIIDEKISNKSKYIEWLIYQDLLKNYNEDEIKKIII